MFLLPQTITMVTKRSVMVRVSPDVYKLIENKAVSEDRSISNVCRLILAKEFKNEAN